MSRLQRWLQSWRPVQSSGSISSGSMSPQSGSPTTSQSTSPSAARPWRLLELLLAVAVLAIALTFTNGWPGLGIVPQPDVSIEALALVALGIFLQMRARDARAAQRRLAALSALLAVMVLLHYVNVTVPAQFGRSFNVFWDGRHVPRVLVMAATNSPGWLVAVATAAALAGIAALYGLCRWALRTVIGAALASGHAPRIAGTLAGCAVLAAAFGTFGPSPHRDHVVTPLTRTYGQQLLLVAAIFTPGAADRLLAPSPVFASNLGGLRGADVMILFNESYGAATFEVPLMAAALQPARALLAQALTTSQRQAASAYVLSPTFGGGSWLAHAALLSGVDMRVADHHALLLSSQRPSLVGHFKAQGYRSLALMPGLQLEWPEGAYYGFDRLYDANALDYRGPEFGFWRVPDQYSIGRLHREEFARAADRPRFVVFPTINTHIPFDPLPPLAADWRFASRDAAPSAFADALDPEQVRTALARPLDWTRLPEAYVRSIDYSLRWLSAYLRDLAPRELLLIVIGDHQPASSVAGRDADWAVPVHVIASSPELIGRFIDAGFTPGLTPQRPAIGQMHELTPMLLRLFESCRSAPCEPARVDVSRTRPGG